MGGEFYALISIKAKSTDSITKIAAQLSVEIQKGPVEVSGGGAGDFSKSEAMKDSTTSIRQVNSHIDAQNADHDVVSPGQVVVKSDQLNI